MKKKGLLISFEGGEACGKGTQIKKIKQYFEDNNIDYLITREPGGTEVGEQLRNLLLHSKADMSSEVEFLIFSASRRQIVEKVIAPALAEGKVVVLDRFYDSSYAYQGYAGNIKIEDVKAITDFAIAGYETDLTFLLDVDYDEAMRRKMSDENLKNLDRMESKGREYHENVRAGYLQLAKDNPHRIFVVDALQTQEAVFECIKNRLEEELKKM
ncbi:MAG: dTMP kinase [Clostridia bacterium]|nr:dTMP kinase [Clostridia bacterium]